VLLLGWLAVLLRRSQGAAAASARCGRWGDPWLLPELGNLQKNIQIEDKVNQQTLSKKGPEEIFCTVRPVGRPMALPEPGGLQAAISHKEEGDWTKSSLSLPLRREQRRLSGVCFGNMGIQSSGSRCKQADWATPSAS
jgi:hypothetical protein